MYASAGASDSTVLYEYTDFLKSGFEKFARFGFAVLDIDGASISVSYRAEDGAEHRNEVIA